MEQQTLKSKVKAALDRFVTDTSVEAIELEDVPPGKVAGTLVSKQFEGKPTPARQDLVWDALDAALDEYERTRVVIVLAETPEEHQLYKDSA